MLLTHPLPSPPYASFLLYPFHLSWQNTSFITSFGPLVGTRQTDLAFDILYYVVGSLSSYDEKVIYFFLDWGNSPARAIAIVTFLFFVALPLAHGMHVLVARGRERLRRMHPQWGWQVRVDLIDFLPFDLLTFSSSVPCGCCAKCVSRPPSTSVPGSFYTLTLHQPRPKTPSTFILLARTREKGRDRETSSARFAYISSFAGFLLQIVPTRSVAKGKHLMTTRSTLTGDIK